MQDDPGNKRPGLRWVAVPARHAERDGSDPSPSAPSNARYREGQELYLQDAAPRLEASAIVDNTDLASPRRTFQDYC